MHDPHRSVDGIHRRNIYNNARLRSLQRGLPFDAVMMHRLAYGHLPATFDGMPYCSPARDQKKAQALSRSVDRIVSCKGYIPGNVRFLPMWLNTSLQHFSDDKAYRIVERLVGARPRIASGTIPLEQHRSVRRSISGVRARATGRGIGVSTCFSFEALHQMGLFTERCPFSGIKLRYSRGGQRGGQADSPSFDRFDPSGGYTSGNVQVLAMSVTALKNNIPVAELPKLCGAISFLRTPDFWESHVPACAR
eukprot:UN1399